MCGVLGKRYEFSVEEQASLRSLRRGVFARQALAPGERITTDNVLLAIPVADGQLTANDLSKYTEFHTRSAIKEHTPVLFEQVSRVETREKVYAIVQRVKALLKKSKVVTPGQADLEISHHYGLDRFDEYGITMITVVNREYCKKLIIMLPSQKHPEQYHKVKEETFHILWGEVLVTLDGVQWTHRQGDVVVIEPGVKHSFTTRTGTVIEEISSTHYKDDSYYTDPQITQNRNRKTLLTYWMD
jgi:quercetin dioxygenase-like cupin family protein